MTISIHIAEYLASPSLFSGFGVALFGKLAIADGQCELFEGDQSVVINDTAFLEWVRSANLEPYDDEVMIHGAFRVDKGKAVCTQVFFILSLSDEGSSECFG
jgi:hypothetical protein